MSTKLLSNVHEVAVNKLSLEQYSLVCGDYDYYHYLCDGFDDRGWGCGYRTLQTICSWINHNHDNTGTVPSIKQIQEILVELEDKSPSFVDSKQWIGSFEVCLVIDKLYNIPCKILHVNKGNELKSIVEALRTHFDKFGSPIMMGGDVDCSSKGVMGLRVNGDDASLLIVDPHYVGVSQTKEFLLNKGYVKWQPLKDFFTSSFYNLCLPQIQAQSKKLQKGKCITSC